MSDFITKLSELIDPEVMGDMVSARIPKKLRVAPFAKIDDTLQGVPGDTITYTITAKNVGKATAKGFPVVIGGVTYTGVGFADVLPTLSTGDPLPISNMTIVLAGY